jgi:uncharacterized membrane-anchored protein YhcB (DUF1043 family)
MNETVYLVAGGVALLLVGVGLGFWIAQLRSGKQVAKAADVQRQFDDYRQSVTAHFGRTAEHFQAIGEQYRELYEHMASGADTLIDPQAMEEKLSLVPTAAIDPPSTDDEPGETETAPGEVSEDADESPRTYH